MQIEAGFARSRHVFTLSPAGERDEHDVAAALDADRPDVLFFDIRMPGMGGLDAAAELADAWPQGTTFPALVFVTAYDQYALQAFEAGASARAACW